jgi:hypothetical protein
MRSLVSFPRLWGGGGYNSLIVAPKGVFFFFRVSLFVPLLVASFALIGCGSSSSGSGGDSPYESDYRNDNVPLTFELISTRFPAPTMSSILRTRNSLRFSPRVRRR